MGDVKKEEEKTNVGAVDVVFLGFCAVLQFALLYVCVNVRFKGEKIFFRTLFAGEKEPEGFQDGIETTVIIIY